MDEPTIRDDDHARRVVMVRAAADRAGLELRPVPGSGAAFDVVIDALDGVTVRIVVP